MSQEKHYYIIDGNSFLYRAFFALPRFSTREGFVTNAIFGFTKMLLKLIKDSDAELVAIAFDHKGKNFRHDEFEEYKAHREKMPDELKAQVPYVKEMVALFGIPILEIEGVEADDSIASFVEMHKDEPGAFIYVVTGDKDMMQLVTDNVVIYDTMKEKKYKREGVKEKMGVYPEQIPDLLGLMGDSSDNIPGVPGVGPKTAVKLLDEYKTLEQVLEHAEEQKGALKKKLEEHKALAIKSRELATVKYDVDLKHIEMKQQEPNFKELIKMCKKFELRTILKEIHDLYEQEVPEEIEKEIAKKDIRSITTQEDFDKIYKQILQRGEVSLSVETESIDRAERLIGVALSYSRDHAYYVPLRHPTFTASLELAYVLEKVSALSEKHGIAIYGHDIKSAMKMIENEYKEGGLLEGETDQLSLF